MEITNLRMKIKAASGQAPGLESSMQKDKRTILRQENNDLTRRAVGPYAMPFVSEAIEGDNAGIGPDYVRPVARQYFNNRKISIYGGSNEIQREIIAKTAMRGQTG